MLNVIKAITDKLVYVSIIIYILGSVKQQFNFGIYVYPVKVTLKISLKKCIILVGTCLQTKPKKIVL